MKSTLTVEPIVPLGQPRTTASGILIDEYEGSPRRYRPRSKEVQPPPEATTPTPKEESFDQQLQQQQVLQQQQELQQKQQQLHQERSPFNISSTKQVNPSPIRQQPPQTQNITAR